MQAISLGLISVPTPGTPVRITTDPTLQAALLMVRTVPGFTGKTYLGLAGMNKTSAAKTGVVRILSEPPACEPQDGEIIPPVATGYGNVVSLSDYWIDADVAGEGVTVTCFVL